MLNDRTISESYRPALWSAMIFSLIIGVLSALMLDGGEIARLSAIGLTVFWASAWVVVWRRPQNPTSVALFLIRWGCAPLIIGFEVAIFHVWRWRGLW